MEDVNTYRVYLSPPYQGGNELEYLEKALSSNWLAPGGPYTKEFEDQLKANTNRKHCVALNSGTSAIHLALIALGVEKGDFVICQTFSFVATSNPIAYLGAVPVFIDSEQESWNMDPELLEEAITDLQKSGIRPKAIIYTHIYGNPADVSGLMAISEKYEIPLIEDAAEALGTKIDSKPIGQFGEISILSFNGNKVITTAGGGALLTDDKQIAERVLKLSTQSKDKNLYYSHDDVGYNYRISNINAALGLAQLHYLEKWISKKRAVFAHYVDELKEIGELEHFREQEICRHNRWLSVFKLKSPTIRDRIIQVLHSKKIESRRFWKPLHIMGIYANQRSYISGISTELFSKGICLPSGVGLEKSDQQEIIDLIKEAL